MDNPNLIDRLQDLTDSDLLDTLRACRANLDMAASKEDNKSIRYALYARHNQVHKLIKLLEEVKIGD